MSVFNFENMMSAAVKVIERSVNSQKNPKKSKLYYLTKLKAEDVRFNSTRVDLYERRYDYDASVFWRSTTYSGGYERTISGTEYINDSTGVFYYAVADKKPFHKIPNNVFDAYNIRRDEEVYHEFNPANVMKSDATNKAKRSLSNKGTRYNSDGFDAVINNYTPYESHTPCATIIWSPMWRKNKKGEWIEFGYGYVNPETKINHYYFYNDETKPNPINWTAIIALFLSCVPIIGLIVGINGFKKSKETGTGKILSIVAIVLNVLVTIGVLTGM